MQALRIKKQIDSDILYLPELRHLMGRNAEIIVLPDSEKVSEEENPCLKDACDSVFSDDSPCGDTAFMSGCENRQLLENINAAHDDMPDTEEQMLPGKMRHFHRCLIMEDGQW